MTVEISGSIIRITGNASVEAAEPLLAALQEDASRTIDLDQVAHLHSAVIQVLLALRPTIIGTPSSAFLTSYLLPLLDPGKGSA